jgi:diguanylate cyclase (GGDEF)-like protein/PAS domain S-box-containing protein
MTSIKRIKTVRERFAATDAQREQAALIAKSADRDRLLLLFYELPFVGLAVTSPSSKRWLQVNDYMCDMLGYSREELLGLAWTETTHPDDLANNLALFKRLLAGEFDAFTFDKRFVRKDGRIVDTTTAVRCVRHADGNVETVVIMVQDITERKLREGVTGRLAAIVESSQDAIMSRSLDGRVESWNAGAERLLGYSAAEIIGRDISIIVPPNLENEFQVNTDLLHQGGIVPPYETVRLAKDGRIVEVSLSASAIVDSLGRTTGVAIIMRDIHERKLAEEALRQSEARFRSLTGLSSDNYWEQDDQYRFTLFSGTGSERIKEFGHDLLGKQRWEQDFVNMSAADWSAHIAMLDARQPFRDMELCRLVESGKKVWIGVSGEPVFDSSGIFKGYRGVGKDITERKEGEEHIHYLANHDALTCLPNRSMFSDVLNLALKNARRTSRALAVLFIDLDRFKIINDTLGHEAGDQLLQEMGRRLTETMRANDVVARLGGDEFVVLVQEAGELSQVEAVARKILAAVIKPMNIRGERCEVTASIGISMYPAHAGDEQSLMKNADIAMYRAKEEGKNTYRFYAGQAA